MEILTAFDVDSLLLRKKLEQLNPADLPLKLEIT